ncbi:pyridoxamine 5'-phosphate oxidase, partial [Burkholderia pseudomallei]
MKQPAPAECDAPPPVAPFHDGELAAQRRAGVAAAAAAVGGRGIRPFLAHHNRACLAPLPC